MYVWESTIKKFNKTKRPNVNQMNDRSTKQHNKKHPHRLITHDDWEEHKTRKEKEEQDTKIEQNQGKWWKEITSLNNEKGKRLIWEEFTFLSRIIELFRSSSWREAPSSSFIMAWFVEYCLLHTHTYTQTLCGISSVECWERGRKANYELWITENRNGKKIQKATATTMSMIQHKRWENNL